TLIEDSIPVGSGSYPWSIPVDQTTGDNFTIIISGMESGDPSDESDAPFSIVEPQPAAAIVINEIMYNPSTALGNDQYFEYLELYNNDGIAVDLLGWDFTKGIEFTFLTSYVLNPGDYVVVAINPDSIMNHYGITNVVGPFPSGLSNSGEEVELASSMGVVADYVWYDDGGLWPTEPDGNGPSLSLLDPNLDNSLPESWAASLQDDGTPGTENFPALPYITVLSPNGGETIQQGTVFDINWIYANYDGDVLIELITIEDVGIAIELGIVPVADGTFAWTVAEDPGDVYKIKISDYDTGEPFDESDAVFSIVPPATLPDIVITEIMYNPPEAGTDSLEFIELYNNDIISINLEGWYFTQGVELIFPNYDLAPGAFLLVSTNAEAIFNTFGETSIQWTSGSLSNSGEDIELRNATGDVIDFVDYDDGGDWPYEADGYGPSITLCDPSSDNALAENWTASIELAAFNAEFNAIYATPGGACSGDLAHSFVIYDGWSGISSYIVPDDPDIENMFAPIGNAAVVLQNFSNLYLPYYQINTIGNWNSHDGYQIKLDLNKYMVIKGTYESNKTVSLAEGWNILPVISTCMVNVVDLVGAVAEVTFIKEMGSELIYWPAGAITTLEFLDPGKAYYIQVSATVDITFPDCMAKDSRQPEKFKPLSTDQWNEVTPKSVSHAIGFSAEALDILQPGDVIGAFTSTGNCAGVTEIGDDNGYILAWGDDIFTQNIDGFVENEEITFRAFRPSTAEEYAVTAVYDDQYENEGAFAVHGISFVNELKLEPIGIGLPGNASIHIYPNPASDYLNVQIPGMELGSFEIYSTLGTRVVVGEISGHNAQLKIGNLENGFYFLKLINTSTGDQIITRFIKQ
nr:lamin tail domain-containing protein [Bacteroidota bacterium]